MVEVVSDDSVGRDRDKKRGEYARAGVSEYWLIDPRPGKRRHPTLWLYQLGEDGRYAEAPPLQAGVVHSGVLPGFWLRVEWLWQDPLPAPLALLTEVLSHPRGPEGPPVLDGLTLLPYAAPRLAHERAEGRAEGLRDAIRRLISVRFGTMVPPALEAALQATDDEAALTALYDRALLAQDVAGLL